jgi:hypothetical protein
MTSKSTDPTRKRLRSQDPDLIVVVGSGESKQEFECYSQILCYKCDHFDTMLSHSMKEKNTSRIELPDNDPEEWELFYDFIDPVTSQETQVTADNAMMLVPWFHEYQMDDLCEKCDKVLYQTRCAEISSKFLYSSQAAEELFDFLEFSDRYSLESSTSKALMELVDLIINRFGFFKQNRDKFTKILVFYERYSTNEQLKTYLTTSSKNTKAFFW